MASHSPAELALVQQLFNRADNNKLGILTGDAALQVFSKTNLPSTTLGEIWAIADKDNNGFLTKKDTAIALRLIGHAQKGEAVTDDLVNKSGPLAHIDGISPAAIPSSPRSPPARPGTANTLPQLTPEDKTKYLRIFVGAGPANGLLSGDKARDIFLKSKLPYDKLSQIWQLADTKNRGSLDSTDFTIAMHFVRAAMSNSSLTLPSTLPLGLYEQAGGQPSAVASHNTGSNAGGLPSSPLGSAFHPQSQPAIKPQFTGGSLNAMRPQYTGQPFQAPPQRSVSAAVPTGSGPFSNHAFKPPTSPNQFWDVSPQEKATFDGFFRNLDPQDKGFIEGDVAVPFLLKSGLNEDVLASVWDLADMHNDGKLTQETFAIAMHLINGKLAGKPLPDRLPETLIPPSQRQSSVKPAPPVSQIHRDLFELENSPSGSPTVPEQPTATAFAPQRSLSLQNTGASGAAFPPLSAALTSSVFTSPPPRPQQQSPFAAQAPTPFKDLLGDDDEGANENAQIHTNAAEIGNLQNKLNSTQQSLKSTQQERKTLEETIAAQASQVSSLQSQLATATAAYETEKNLLETLQGRMTTQNSEIQKTREDLIRRESELSALKLEKSEIEGNLLRDKEDVRQLQQQMKETSDSTELVKAEIEKAKKEARQQKGRLAIAKKQLTTSETEKEKVVQELQAAKLELEQMQKELESTEAQLNANNSEVEKMKAEHAASRTASPAPAEVAARIHIPDTPDVTTPMSQTSTKSTNPFEKLAMASSTPKAESPFQPFTAILPPIQSEPVEASVAREEKSILDDPFGLDSEPVAEPAAEPVDKAAEPTAEMNETMPKPEAAAESTKEENGDAASPPAAEKFPPVEEVAPKSPVKSEEGEFEAVKEIEPADETDSSGDEDNVPLGTLKAARTEASQPELPPGLPNGSNVVATPQEPASVSAFDDIFAPAASRSMEQELAKDAPPTGNVSNTFESAFGDDFAKPSAAQKSEAEEKPKSPAAGVDAFDEAMGKLSSPEPQQSTPGPFSFESNFGDTFDFAVTSNGPSLESVKPSASQAPTSATTAPPESGASGFPSLPPIAADHQPLSFEDTFGELTSKAEPQANGIQTSVPNGGTSFDDVFGTNQPQPTTSVNERKPSQDVPPASHEAATSLALRPSSPQPHEAPSSPTSPDRTLSSHRSISPPPRLPHSPVRKSSGSKSQEEKRSHKLSIRFPFGRRGKDKERSKKGVPLPDSHLSPVGEPTPANEDDTEPLKALCSMGFSRTQALSALETHNFDVARALNSLLGSQ